jgi:hypothetical protein
VARWVIKRLSGRARREAAIYEALRLTSAGKSAPALIAVKETEAGALELYIEQVVPQQPCDSLKGGEHPGAELAITLAAWPAKIRVHLLQIGCPFARKSLLNPVDGPPIDRAAADLANVRLERHARVRHTLGNNPRRLHRPF